MKAPKEIFVGVIIALIVGMVSIRHFSNAGQTDQQAASSLAMMVKKSSSDNGIEKRISKETIGDVFKENGSADYVVIDLYQSIWKLYSGAQADNC